MPAERVGSVTLQKPNSEHPTLRSGQWHVYQIVTYCFLIFLVFAPVTGYNSWCKMISFYEWSF